MRSSKRLLTLLSILALAGCASAPPVVKVQVIQPPADLTQACQEPAQAVQTTRDMVTYLLDLRDALRGCNAQLESLRQWEVDTVKAISK